MEKKGQQQLYYYCVLLCCFVEGSVAFYTEETSSYEKSA